jgi:hypothetical protein
MTTRLLKIAQGLASGTPGFFKTKGPGSGNKATNAFMKKLRLLALEEFKEDFAEKKICGDNAFAVDYYFPKEATIVEVALGLSKPNTEYEKDVLKAVMAKEMGSEVAHLMFISKPGACAKCSQPGRLAIKNWVKRHHNIGIEVHELDVA